MQFVASGLQGRIENAAAGASHLRVVGVGLNLDFLRSFDRGNDDRAVHAVGDRNIVNEVVVPSNRSAGDADLRRSALILEAVKSRIADGGDAIIQPRKKKWVASENREVREFLRINHLTVRGI